MSGFLGGGIGPTAIKRRSGRWYTAGGAPLPAIAYQPKGAVSLAASYVNLANPGTYDAAPGTAPTLAVNGWQGNGSSAYLTTGYKPTDNAFLPQSLSLIVRVVNASTGVASGVLNAAQNGIRVWPVSGANLIVTNGGATTVSNGATSNGVIAVAGGTVYVNGAQVGVISAAVSAAVPTLTILAQNFNGAIGNYFSGTIAAFALYEFVLPGAQVAAVSAAMAAL